MNEFRRGYSLISIPKFAWAVVWTFSVFTRCRNWVTEAVCLTFVHVCTKTFLFHPNFLLIIAWVDVFNINDSFSNCSMFFIYASKLILMKTGLKTMRKNGWNWSDALSTTTYLKNLSKTWVQECTSRSFLSSLLMLPIEKICPFVFKFLLQFVFSVFFYNHKCNPSMMSSVFDPCFWGKVKYFGSKSGLCFWGTYAIEILRSFEKIF